jgi:hypothetical protein
VVYRSPRASIDDLAAEDSAELRGAATGSLPVKHNKRYPVT